ncbi:hypothetical protein [Micromonospora antibiotica]|uniref:Uncharacterized protein n=1 Tax=Micromonospora antibiotica TaxID=2807623 RepID=A0ABS3VHF5_9ACTN|nr:hypothetical protein [Micromonospora antibiotica]MBO4165064.1 hypothetical protein [Micromonospora antibiotica]
MTPDAPLFDPLLTVDLSHFELRPLHLGILFGAFGIDTRAKFHIISSTFEVGRDLLAPLMVKAAVDILPHLQSLVQRDRRTRIVFAGRDSFGLGYVISAIDPGFSADHCRSLYLTRTIVDAALTDLERQGRSFAEIELFRKRGTGAPDERAWRHLRDYLEASDLRLETAPGPVVIVDTGYKGSIQEMLAAAYPDVPFTGHYVFYSAAPGDPHGSSKRGHIFDAGTGPARGGRALRDELPHDPSLTFAHHEAIVAVEELLQGSQLSPTAIDPTGRPRLRRARRTGEPYEGLNPVLIGEEFTDPILREGVLAFNVLAVSRLARRVAVHIDPSVDGWHRTAAASVWYQELTRQVERLRDNLRGWISRDARGEAHPVLRRMLDSFVHRGDRHLVRALDERIREWPVERQAQIWVAFDRCPTLAAKSAFRPDGVRVDTVEIPPVLVRRDRAVAALRSAAPAITVAQAHRVARALTDDLEAARQAGVTLADTRLPVDVYLDAYHAHAEKLLESDLRAVSRLPLLVTRHLAGSRGG